MDAVLLLFSLPSLPSGIHSKCFGNLRGGEHTYKQTDKQTKKEFLGFFFLHVIFFLLSPLVFIHIYSGAWDSLSAFFGGLCCRCCFPEDSVLVCE